MRGLHLSQDGIADAPTSASLFDLAMIAFQVDWEALRHPLCIYIPKSESADEALWWRDALRADASLAKGLNTYDGDVTYGPVAEAHGLPYRPPAEVLA